MEQETKSPVNSDYLGGVQHQLRYLYPLLPLIKQASKQNFESHHHAENTQKFITTIVSRYDLKTVNSSGLANHMWDKRMIIISRLFFEILWLSLHLQWIPPFSQHYQASLPHSQLHSRSSLHASPPP